MVELTLLEIHLDDSTLTANAPYSHGEKDVVAGEESPTDGGDSATGGSKKGGALAAVVGLVFLAAIAFLARKKFLDGDDAEYEDEFEA